MMNALLDITDVERPGKRPKYDRGTRPLALHLITSLEVGGTERQAVELLKRLNRERFDVRLAVLRLEGPFYREIAPLFPQVAQFPLTSFYNANAARQLARLRALLVRERINLLHAHDFYAGVLGAAAARLSGVRVIVCQRHLRLSDRRVHEWGTRFAHRLAHRVLVNSEAIRDQILNAGRVPPKKLVVVRNGFDVAARFNSEERQQQRASLLQELNLDAGVRLVGMVARLQPVKGHRYFIEAASQIAQAEPGARFLLVGDGALRQEIETQAARYGLADRVHLLGDRSDAARIAAAFDVAVLSSLHEGLPNTVMEAMAAGVPVVATAVGGTTELVMDGETGFLVPPADAGALAQRILSVLRNPAWGARMAEQGRQHILGQFGMNRMVESVEQLYDELLEVPV
jgi:glycosyltransferase involved in cell wall biosynthesis